MNNHRLATTAVAARRIAVIDRDRLNEAIFAGEYPGHPETIKGRAREFDEGDLVRLYIFARLLEFGAPRKKAGIISKLIVIQAWIGNLSVVEYPLKAERGLPIMTLSFNISEIRRAISEKSSAK